MRIPLKKLHTPIAYSDYAPPRSFWTGAARLSHDIMHRRSGHTFGERLDFSSKVSIIDISIIDSVNCFAKGGF